MLLPLGEPFKPGVVGSNPTRLAYNLFQNNVKQEFYMHQKTAFFDGVGENKCASKARLYLFSSAEYLF